jgi:N utilization substance protein B
LTDNYESDQPDFDQQDVTHSEVIEHAEATNPYSLARRVALQILYEVDSSNHSAGEVMNSQLAYHELSEKSLAHLRRLVHGVLENRTWLDAAVQRFAPEFPLQQVAIVDRNILRMATLEFALLKNAPVGVVIDEAVNLAQLFGAEGTPRFVNGVLGAMATDLEQVESLLSDADDQA